MHKKNAGGFPPVFPNAPKGRKGEKEMGILNHKIGVQSPEERECRRESESLNPNVGDYPCRRGIPPLTNRNVIHFYLFVKYFCQIYFLVLFLGLKALDFCGFRKWLLLNDGVWWNKINIRHMKYMSKYSDFFRTVNRGERK